MSKYTEIIREKIRNKEKFHSKILYYTPTSIAFRVLFNSVVAILMILFIKYIFKDVGIDKEESFDTYFRVIVVFNILSELLIISDLGLEKYFPVPDKIRLRIFVQLVIALIIIVVMFNFAIYINPQLSKVPKFVQYVGFIVGFAFVTFLSTSLLVFRMTGKWIQSQKEIDEMKQEKLRMDYNSLQDQLNPHFLFNNLSVLKSLIMYDKDKALTFTDNFTDVYRYVLKSKDERLVSLRTELEFINSYVGLHKERIGDGLIVNYSIEQSIIDMKIAPLTIQLLVENAIKHNITSKENPLEIIIITDKEGLIVKNNLQLKSSSYSTQTGLDNLIKRYAFLTNSQIVIEENNDKFVVKVPLL